MKPTIIQQRLRGVCRVAGFELPVICTPHGLLRTSPKVKTKNPIEEIWRIRDELAAEEGNDVHTVFEILRREEKKHGVRVRPLRGTPAGESLVLREEPPKAD